MLCAAVQLLLATTVAVRRVAGAVYSISVHIPSHDTMARLSDCIRTRLHVSARPARGNARQTVQEKNALVIHAAVSFTHICLDLRIG
jgi:hypothetical protein